MPGNSFVVADPTNISPNAKFVDNFQDDEFANNLVIENEADGGLVDFSESNPFGSF